MGLASRLRSLLGVSAYQQAPRAASYELSDAQVEKIRAERGGQIQPFPESRTRWYLKDLETALHHANAGNLALVAQLSAAARSDGIFAGVLSTRTDGLVRLPKKWMGRAEIVKSLQAGHESVRSVFDEMCPPAELALLAADGLMCGVGFAELVPVEGRSYPRLTRLDPQFLIYRWNENRWYFRSVAGLLPITPGDGRWVLHTPGGVYAPWQTGLWQAIGKSWIRKTHAGLHKDNWEAKLANPARVATAPNGASDEHSLAWFKAVMAWGVNTVFALRPGYDVKLLESNGRGADSFDTTQDRSDKEMIVAVAGQEVTVDGGAGFQNSDVHKTIRADLIQATADGLAYTINTQVIPPYVVDHFGEEALDESAIMAWDVTPPKDRNSEALSVQTVGTAIKAVDEALAPHGKRVDVETMAERFAIPTKGGATQQPKPTGPAPVKEAA